MLRALRKARATRRATEFAQTALSDIKQAVQVEVMTAGRGEKYFLRLRLKTHRAF